jgi:sialic acid synthase SpsE
MIIAEASVCHQGDLNIAKKMCKVAKDCGADAIKFQTWNPQIIQRTEEFKKEINKYLLIDEELTKLKQHCDKIGIEFMCTAHTTDKVKVIDPLVKRHKIGSGALRDDELIKTVAKCNKDIFLSMGMADVGDIYRTLTNIRRYNKKEITLMHCTSSYPCDDGDVNLRAMTEICYHLIGINHIGFSDHTLSPFIPGYAVVRGAEVIEKHFTLDNNLDGPDHKMSLNPQNFKIMVDNIRWVEKILGNPNKQILDCERKTMELCRLIEG